MSDLVIEVRGGVVVEVYSRTPKKHVTIIDWDNIEAVGSPKGVIYQCARYKSMPGETRHATESSIESNIAR